MGGYITLLKAVDVSWAINFVDQFGKSPEFQDLREMVRTSSKMIGEKIQLFFEQVNIEHFWCKIVQDKKVCFKAMCSKHKIKFCFFPGDISQTVPDSRSAWRQRNGKKLATKLENENPQNHSGKYNNCWKVYITLYSVIYSQYYTLILFILLFTVKAIFWLGINFIVKIKFNMFGWLFFIFHKQILKDHTC